MFWVTSKIHSRSTRYNIFQFCLEERWRAGIKPNNTSSRVAFSSKSMYFFSLHFGSKPAARISEMENNYSFFLFILFIFENSWSYRIT